VVEVGLGRVDGDDRHATDAHDGVAVAEELLEVDVADVTRVVVARDDDDRLAVDRVDVLLGERVLLLEPERRQVAGDDDDLRLKVVDLGDRTFEQVWQEELRAAMQIGDLDDRERAVTGRDSRSLGCRGPPPHPGDAAASPPPAERAPAFSASGPVATLNPGDTGNA
jgi:hypothetical protein